MSQVFADSGAAIVFAVCVAWAAHLTLGLIDRARERRAGVRVVRGKRYRVTGYTTEGEPRLTRIDTERISG